MNNLYIILSLIVLIIAVIILSCLLSSIKEPFFSSSKKVEYYSMSSCPHCIDFNPLWKKFEKSCDNSVKYVIDKINIDNRLQKFNINSFPTIIVTENDNKIDELDNRSCDGLKKLCQKHNISCDLQC